MKSYTGFGFDVHRLAAGRRLVLGGVEIPFEMGLEGHSDADVLAHAVADALLGAAGLGDIGEHFPDTDPDCRDISSVRTILGSIAEMLRKNNFRIVNADCTIVAERPKISGYKSRIRENIASALSVDIERVNIKATTTEGLGFTGRGEGIAAYAAVNLIKQDGGTDGDI